MSPCEDGRGWATAVRFCLANKIHLDDDLLWARRVTDPNFGGQENVWPVHLGLARGHAALGHKEQAIAEAKLPLPQAPDPANQEAVKDFIARLEAGKP